MGGIRMCSGGETLEIFWFGPVLRVKRTNASNHG